MEALVTDPYTRLDKKSKLFATNSIVIGTKELFQRKIYVKKHFSFFTKWHFENFANRMNLEVRK